MKLGKIYETVIKKGIDFDPRGKEQIEKHLKLQREVYDELKGDKKELFDREKLTNPFADTRILFGDTELKVKKVLVGIDIEIGEVVLADRLKQEGKEIDLIIAHHPEGRAMANFYEVMHMQADILNKFGVPINVAEGILEPRIKEVSRRVMPANYNRTVDAARLLGIPLMCVHTPSDNAVTNYLQKELDNKKPEYVKDVLDFLNNIPEYRLSQADQSTPAILAGSEKKRAGKIFVDMTGGTGGSKEAFEKLSRTEVGTIVGMHISEDHLKEAEKNHINVIIAGHMSSDSLGMNLMLDEILKKEGIEVIPCSGFTRIARI